MSSYVRERFEVSRQYQKGDVYYTFITHVVRAYKPNEAAKFMRGWRAAATGCTHWTDKEEDGTKTKNSISPLAFPDLGDDTLAFSIKMQNPNFSSRQERAYVRMGDAISLLSYVSNVNVDSDDMITVTKRAAERLAKVTGWAD